MEDCIFCKIIKGDIPCYKIYEDERFLSFLDINPLNPGHALVIPKEHIEWVWDVPYVGEYFEVVGKLANAMRKSLKPWLVACSVLGVDVPHAHIHVVPRYRDDGHGGSIDPSNIKKLSEDGMKSIAEKIRKAVE